MLQARAKCRELSVVFSSKCDRSRPEFNFFSTTSVFRVPAVDKIFNKASEEASLFSVIIDPLSLMKFFFILLFFFPVLSSAFSSTLNILLYKTFYLCDLGVGNVWGSSTVKVNESRLVEPCSCHAVDG